MWKSICYLLVCFAAFANASQWKTVSGEAPLVIARGGFSGVFPESSEKAYAYGSRLSLPNTVSWCNVQLSFDGVLFCLPELNMQNSTNIQSVYPNGSTYRVIDGVVTKGWFASHFLFEDLKLVNLTQSVSTRTSDFNNKFRILSVDDVANISVSPTPSNKSLDLWLNFQHTDFYKDEGLSMIAAAVSASNVYKGLKFVSSPELMFLKGFRQVSKHRNVGHILRFPENVSAVDASTNRPYQEYLTDMRYLESVQGILVPASYIWPLDSQSNLLPHTSLVSKAHRLGIAVYVYGISNDMPYANNFNYDPISANLAFVENSDFSVDGILSDFLASSSAAIDCYSHMGKDDPPQRNVMIIAQENTSSLYPGCTDLAYNTAFDDGADFVTCPAQITNDALIMCLGSINLSGRTNVDKSPYSHLARVVPDLGPDSGVFTFDLLWEQIAELKPKFFKGAPSFNQSNPEFENTGRYMTLDELVRTISSQSGNTTKNVKGLLISIENADYITKLRGFDVVERVLQTVRDIPINQTDFKIMIQSSDKSVLMKVKEDSLDNYTCLYANDDDLRHADDAKISQVKQFADSVVVSKEMEYPENHGFLTGETKILQKLKAAGFPVYVSSFRNEYTSSDYDFFRDPSLELNTFVERAGADGVITAFPATANGYRRNRCLAMSEKPSYMTPIQPGELMKYVKGELPPLIPPIRNRRFGKHQILA